ncbi:MAG: hypothetical protein IPP90_09530 [Gemmatimonadaceae bacterium]|nr:hypothetical protein [Gemmatimonadaceae bacterium]
MPLSVSNTAPSLAIRRAAFERADLTRQAFDEALGLTPDEFRMEANLILIGPLVGEATLTDLIDTLEARGLVYFDDFFELSGNWPDWLKLFATESAAA